MNAFNHLRQARRSCARSVQCRRLKCASGCPLGGCGSQRPLPSLVPAVLRQDVKRVAWTWPYACWSCCASSSHAGRCGRVVLLVVWAHSRRQIWRCAPRWAKLWISDGTSPLRPLAASLPPEKSSTKLQLTAESMRNYRKEKWPEPPLRTATTHRWQLRGKDMRPNARRRLRRDRSASRCWHIGG